MPVGGGQQTVDQNTRQKYQGEPPVVRATVRDNTGNNIKDKHPVPGKRLNMCGSPGELSEELVTQEKRKKGWRMNCDVGEAKEGLENQL